MAPKSTSLPQNLSSFFFSARMISISFLTASTSANLTPGLGVGNPEILVNFSFHCSYSTSANLTPIWRVSNPRILVYYCNSVSGFDQVKRSATTNGFFATCSTLTRAQRMGHNVMLFDLKIGRPSILKDNSNTLWIDSLSVPWRVFRMPFANPK